MKPQKRLNLGYFAVLGLVALLLPALSLMLLGSVWLWQNGYLLPWAGAAFGAAVLVYLWQLYLLRPASPRDTGTTPIKDEDEIDGLETGAPDPLWNPAERGAWNEVERIAAHIDPDALRSRDDIFQLGWQTVEAVARQLHPGEKDPVFKFTIPEALTLVSRVTAKMRPALEKYMPLSDQVTVGQMMKFYGWRSWATYAGRAYDVWRVLRLANPAVAVTNEMRERISRRLMSWGRDEVTRKLARLYVEEVGRAAIDLYGGRLVVSGDELADYISPLSQKDMAAAAARTAEPLRLLFAGPAGCGRQHVVAAITSCLQPHNAAHRVDTVPGEGPGVHTYLPPSTDSGGVQSFLIDSPPLEASTISRKMGGVSTYYPAFLEQAGNADLVIMVISALRPGNKDVRGALADLESYFERNPKRTKPPVLVLVSDIARLPREEGPANSTIRQIAGEIASTLAVPVENVIPVQLAERVSGQIDVADQIGRVWQRLQEILPEAQSARLLRTLAGSRRRFSLKRLAEQAVNAGKALIRRSK